MRIVLLVAVLGLASCATEHLALDMVPLSAARESGAQSAEPMLPTAMSAATIPAGTAVFGMREMFVKVNWDKATEWDKVKDTVLFYSWDNGDSWNRSDSKLERRVINGNETHVFKLSTDRDGLLGLYFINPTDEPTDAPAAKTMPKRYVYIDTMKPKPQAIFVVRASESMLHVAWSFSDEVLSDKGVKVSVNGTEVLADQPAQGEADVSVQPGAVTVSLTCADRAGNISEAATATLP